MMAGAPDATDAARWRAVLVGRVRGVPIRVHWTLLVALPFFAWLMAQAHFGTDAAGWAWGAGLAVALFASVTLHELAHSLVALRRGESIREIILLPIGGASVMERPSRDPAAELAIAVVGPLASLALGSAALLAAFALGVPFTLPRAQPAPQAFLLMLGYLNVMLGLFNLLVPAFPMDGGRVLRAALARRVGLVRATRVAAGVGRVVAVLMGAAGLLVGNLILVLVAVFVWAGARTEERGVVLSATLEGLTVRDIMATTPATVDEAASVDDALQTMLATKHLALPVLRDGRPVALLTAEDVARVGADARRSVTAGEAASPHVRVVRPEEEAPEALPVVLQSGLVAVVDAAGRLLGVVTPTDVLRLVQITSLARRA